MARPQPDLSPAMLRMFLRARIKAYRFTHAAPLYQAYREISRIVRRDAGVTAKQFDDALAGRADAETLAKVWRGIGVGTGEGDRC